MKKLLTISMALVALILSQGCEKDSSSPSGEACNNLPHTAAPAALTGNWASGYTSLTQVVDVYDGRYLGNTWQSGKFFKITADGKNAEFYYMAQSQLAQTATKATGTIAFDAGSTAQEGSFTFHACWGHYKGWGTTTVDRDASESEVKNNLTARYFYRVEGQWLRIQPGGPVNDFTSSFKLVN